LAGCEFGDGDAKVPGEPLGTFDVVAKLETSDCGAGALGSTETWQFVIKLSRDYDQLFWLNGREVITGSIASDGRSFELDSWVEVDAIAAKPGQAGCSLTRTGRASGTLGQVTEIVGSLTGQHTLSATPQAESACSPLVGVEAGFRALPCSMSYHLDAQLSPEK